MMAIMAPSLWPLKNGPFAGGKPQGAGVCALWGQQWTRLPIAAARSTAATGAWPSPSSSRPPTPRQGAQLLGSISRDRGPPWRPLRSSRFAGGKILGCRGADAFGGAHELARLFSQPREVLPQRGHDLRPPPWKGQPRRECRPEGSAIGIVGPVVAPEKLPIAGEKAWGP
jgi:hypothetical protein